MLHALLVTAVQQTKHHASEWCVRDTRRMDLRDEIYGSVARLIESMPETRLGSLHATLLVALAMLSGMVFTKR